MSLDTKGYLERIADATEELANTTSDDSGTLSEKGYLERVAVAMEVLAETTQNVDGAMATKGYLERIADALETYVDNGGGSGGGEVEPLPGCYVNGYAVDIENSTRVSNFDEPWTQNELHLVFADGNTLDTRVDENGYTDPPMVCFYEPVNVAEYHVNAEDDFEVLDYLIGAAESAEAAEGSFFAYNSTLWIDGHKVDNAASTFEFVEMTAETLRVSFHIVFADGAAPVDGEATASGSTVTVPAAFSPLSVTFGTIESLSRLIGELPEAQ